MVKPILCYVSEVWVTEFANVIESVYLNFLKYFLGVNFILSESPEDRFSRDEAHMEFKL